MKIDFGTNRIEAELRRSLERDPPFREKLERSRSFRSWMDSVLGLERGGFLEEIEACCAGVEGGEKEHAGGRELPLGTYGDFRLERKLGWGSMGVVYKAWQISAHRWVALKTLSPRLIQDREARRRFQREMRAAARVDHPAICTVYEHDELVSFPCIAMRYINGPTLQERVRIAAADHRPSITVSHRELFDELSGDEEESSAHGGGDDEDPVPRKPELKREQLVQLLRTFEAIARGLHAAHASGLVHRDIKPGNIMIAPDGEPVIVDFGLALLGEKGAIPETGESAIETAAGGTPAYMSPEQIVMAGACRVRPRYLSGEHTIDQRADVFSLGITLYECLTLHHPFASKTRRGAFRKILYSEPQSPSRVNPAIGDDLDALLARALEKNPKQRYPTALELADDLRRIRMNEPLPWRRNSPAKRAKLWVKRNPVGAALILVLSLGLGISFLLLSLLVQSIGERNEIIEAIRENHEIQLATLADDQSPVVSVDSWTRALLAERPLLPQGGRQLRFAVYRSDPPRKLYEMFDPLLTILEKETGLPIHLDMYLSYADAIDAIAAGEVDLARFGPASYAEATRKDPGIVLLAREERNGRGIFFGQVIVKKGGRVEKIDDLRNGTIVFGAPASTIGTVLFKRLLLRAGFAPEDFPGPDRHIVGHNNVADAVLEGEADAGCVKEGTFTNGRYRPGLRSIARVENVTKPWLARSGLEPRIVEAIREALLALDETDPRDEKVLDAVVEGKDRLTGFIRGDDGDFDFIREALELSRSRWPATGVPEDEVEPDEETASASRTSSGQGEHRIRR